jgi:hypothetical protein
MLAGDGSEIVDIMCMVKPNAKAEVMFPASCNSLMESGRKLLVTEITQPCVHTCNSLFICQLYLLPDLLEETDCKEDTPLMLPFCIVRFPLTVDNSDMN